jgi:hypothetical protein
VSSTVPPPITASSDDILPVLRKAKRIEFACECIYVFVCMRRLVCDYVKEREGERERGRERKRGRERERQREKERGRERQREKERESMYLCVCV